jgi:hypothetical protein
MGNCGSMEPPVHIFYFVFILNYEFPTFSLFEKTKKFQGTSRRDLECLDLRKKVLIIAFNLNFSNKTKVSYFELLQGI